MLQALLIDILDHIDSQTLTDYFLIHILVLLLSTAFAYFTRGALLASRHPRHLRRIGLTSSHLDDQYDQAYGIPEEASPKGSTRIKALFIYPIKSCRPIELRRALLTKIGLAYDRCFALVVTRDDGSCDFISQRTRPLMALVRQELWLPDEESDPDDELVKAGGCLVISFPDPDMPSFTTRLRTALETGSLSSQPSVHCKIPLLPVSADSEYQNLEKTSFKIHGRPAAGLDFSGLPDIAVVLPKLKRFLKIPARQSLTLVRCTKDNLTRTTKNLAPLKYINGTPAVHGYTDQQPLHIVNLSSVHALSKLLPPENRPLNANRFRANVYFSGASAYHEETWKRFRIRTKHVSPTISVVCRTSRCPMPNVDPNTGIVDHDLPPEGKSKGKPQPSTSLIKYRTVEDGNPGALGYMGMHCVPEAEGMYVEVGDEIEVLETGEHLYGSTGNDY